MNCTQSEDLLQRRLDGEAVAGRADLAAHLAECAGCRALHAAAGRLEQGLSLRKAPAVPAGMNARIVSAALADRRARTMRRRVAFVGFAAAACLLVALGLSFVQVGEGRNPLQAARQQVVKLFWPGNETYTLPPMSDTRFVATTSLEQPKTPSVRDSVADAGNAMVALGKRTADETKEQTKLLTEVLPMPLNVFDTKPPAPEPMPLTTVWQETGQRVSTGFEPVTSSARRAFSMFVRELPPSN